MKKKRINLFLGAIVILVFLTTGQVIWAQNIVKVDLDGSKSIKELLGESINEVDSLVISGKMTDEDFVTVRMASIYGKLTGIDISNAELKDDTLPKEAFWGYNKRINTVQIHTHFKYISLPDNLVALDFESLGCNFELKYVNIPATVKDFGHSVFTDCYEVFKGQCVEIPAGVTIIPAYCFESCRGIVDIKFPDGLRRIEDHAFTNCNFNDLILPENLEYIGYDAFVCVEYIPNDDDIRSNAIKGDIYCKAVVPPVCDDFENRGHWPFVEDADKTVYVPVGSAEAYREAPGWNQFTKFVEIEEFPTTGLTEVAMPDADSAVYDLQGNKVTAPVKGQIYISDGKKFVAR